MVIIASGAEYSHYLSARLVYVKAEKQRSCTEHRGGRYD